MKSPIRLLATLLLLTVVALVGGTSNSNPTLAADYRCTGPNCPGQAQCSGDVWTQSGTCQITCYKESGAPGQIVFNGSANCSPPSSGTGGGSGGGYAGLQGSGSYCAQNWIWDSACHGPDDPYTPQ